MADDCVFCKILRKEIPSEIVYEDDDIVAFEDLNPKAPVHVLVIPKKHIAHLSDMTSSDLDLAGKLLLAIPVIAERLNIHSDGFRIVLNNGPNALQTVDHVHFHLLGGRVMGWSPA